MEPSLVDLRRDLARLEDLLRWAHNDAYRPEGQRDRRAPVYPAYVQAMIDADPDYVPARAVRDIGLGNDRRRNAYAYAVEHVARAEVHAANAARLARVDRQPGLVRPRPHYALALVVLTLARVRIRLELAGASTDAAADVREVGYHVDRAIRVLDRAFSEGRAGAGLGPLENPCRNAPRGCPNLSEPGRTRCWPCYAWHRDKGTERPKRQFKVRLGAAQAAAERRAARGEGWGAG